MLSITREDSLSLLKEYTKSESLIKHALSVEAAMKYYAKEFNEDEHLWATTGLLHDFDYEQYPSVEEHPFVGCKILKEKGYPETMTTAILGHATYSGVPRESQMAKCLFAVDELCGMVMAATLVRPDKSIAELSVKSVKKKLKDKRFAQGVNREDVMLGVKELEVELDQHIANVIAAMQTIAAELGV